jgi:hypothetical protein
MYFMSSQSHISNINNFKHEFYFISQSINLVIDSVGSQCIPNQIQNNVFYFCARSVSIHYIKSLS